MLAGEPINGASSGASNGGGGASNVGRPMEGMEGRPMEGRSVVGGGSNGGEEKG